MDMELFVLSATFLLMLLHFYECAVNVLQFTHLSELDGFTCPSSEENFRRIVAFGDPMACLLECAGSTACLSSFYHNGTGQCVGCINMYKAPFDEGVGYIESYPGTFHYVKQVCPLGWRGWRRACYKKTSTKGSFQTGVDTCAIDQGHVVFIENRMENDFLQDLFRNKYGAFMYIGYIFKSSQWVYYETEEVASFTLYASDQGKLYPTGRDCSVFAAWHPSLWYNRECSSNYPTLCEINL